MTETQRVKKVINWLVFMEYAENERELAEKVRLYKVIILTDSKWKSAFVGKICAEIGVCR